MTGNKVKRRNGIEYNFESKIRVYEKKRLRPSTDLKEETRFMTGLHDKKADILAKIQQCRICPAGYRRKLYRQLQCVDISKKEAGTKLEELEREVGMISFNLLLNPTWVRGLLKLTDEILDQTPPEERKRLSSELDQLQTDLSGLKRECKIFQLEL